MSAQPYPSLVFELQQFVAARLASRRAAFQELAQSLAAAVVPNPTPHTVAGASVAIERYVGDRALVEATALFDGQETASVREGLVYSLGLAAVGHVLDTANAEPAQPQDAAPEAALAVLRQAYELITP
jgi:hypothetical protein